MIDHRLPKLRTRTLGFIAVAVLAVGLAAPGIAHAAPTPTDGPTLAEALATARSPAGAGSPTTTR